MNSQEPGFARPPHWQEGPHSEHPLVARLCGVDIYSESGYVQAHLTTGYDPEVGQYVRCSDGSRLPERFEQRGWVVINADGTLN